MSQLNDWQKTHREVVYPGAMSTPTIPEVGEWVALRHYLNGYPVTQQAGDDLASRLERCEAALREVVRLDAVGLSSQPGCAEAMAMVARDALARPEGASS